MILDVLIELNIVDEFSVDSNVTISTEELYYNTYSIANKLLSVKPMNSSVLNAPHISTSTSFVLALPKIDLPKYDGNLIQWKPFRDKFVSLIRRNDNLSKIDRFHYLLSCLSDLALSCISSLPLTNSNYDIAWKTLMNRYYIQRLLTSAHLDFHFAQWLQNHCRLF
ncbi:uncharacterized protein LOC112681042 [Sipha flava]|uniref:Uncharacterized protein LOC112681042 n=1 Tax=Sipha flava TaxID=143950 RepID=A0A8B8F8Y1_9HEMI|nr:uncharacterized protein LOC112681042 [Sipha flava]